MTHHTSRTTIDRDATLRSLADASAAKGETNDCTVRALAAAGNVSYDEAHAALAKHGRPHRKGPKAEAFRPLPDDGWYVGCPAFQNACKELGVGFEFLPHRDYSAKTMITAERDPALKSGNYVAYVRGHVAAIVDGTVIDWSQGRRHKIKTIWKLTPRQEQPKPAPRPEPQPMQRMTAFAQQELFS